MKPIKRRLVCTVIFGTTIALMAMKEQPHKLFPREVKLPDGFIPIGLTITGDFTQEEMAKLPGTRKSIALVVHNRPGGPQRTVIHDNALVIAVHPHRWEREPPAVIVFFAIKEEERRNLLSSKEMGPLHIGPRGHWWRRLWDGIRAWVA